MNKRFISLACGFVLAGGSLPALAQQSGTVRVDFLGPGGHSSSNYGRTSALHAAGRAVIRMQQSLPVASYVITNVTGGNSVNSIASDGLIEIRLAAANPKAYQALIAAVTDAAAAAAAAENAFRGVNVGDLTGGAPAWIRYTVEDIGNGIAKRRPQPKSFATQRGMPATAAHDHNDPAHICDH